LSATLPPALPPALPSPPSPLPPSLPPISPCAGRRFPLQGAIRWPALPSYLPRGGRKTSPRVPHVSTPWCQTYPLPSPPMPPTSTAGHERQLESQPAQPPATGERRLLPSAPPMLPVGAVLLWGVTTRSERSRAVGHAEARGTRPRPPARHRAPERTGRQRRPGRGGRAVHSPPATQASRGH
jgi:hypothetical protein